MTLPAPEAVAAVAAAAEGGPSLLGAALRVMLALTVMLGAAGAWLWWQRRVRGATRRLEVLDRAVLTRGASVVLLRVDDRNVLVGVSADGVRSLGDVEPAAERFGRELARASTAPRLEAAR